MILGPERELSFRREIRSPSDVKTLGEAIHKLENWPGWFFSLAQAQAIDLAGRPFSQADQTVAPGEIIQLSIDPKKGPWKKFDVWVRVQQYVPNERLTLVVQRDSKDKLVRLFSEIEWTVEIKPRPEGGAYVIGSGRAKTAHWRTRLLGALAEKIVMNQAYYPDLIALAGIRQPRAANPFLPTQQ